MRLFRFLLAASAVLLALGAAPARADVGAHLNALAQLGVANGGTRAAGTPGAEQTVAYLADRLRAYGWQVTTQPVKFPFTTERTPAVLGSAVPGRDFVVARQSGSGDATGRVRTILAERCSARSLRSLRRGEIALIPFLRCTPGRAARLVKDRGGIGVLYDGGPSTFPLRPALSVPAAVPVVIARSSVALRLSESKAPLRLKVDMAIEQRTVENVIAELPGSSRVVMAGGHLDSVPEGVGANDNASGLAALLDVAEKLPAQKPDATVRLGFWNAEEQGLFGSAAYVRGLSKAERKRIAAYVNLDMVGSPNGVTEVYDSDDAIERALRDALPGTEGETQIYEDSDHAPFDRVGIPVGGVYTGGLEQRRGKPRDPCYHRQCDGAANVNVALTARVAEGARKAIVALGRKR
jgi:hypothetical protein